MLGDGEHVSSTRARRQRSLPTKNCPAALRRFGGAIREYQSDSSSKRPAPSALSTLTLEKRTKRPGSGGRP